MGQDVACALGREGGGLGDEEGNFLAAWVPGAQSLWWEWLEVRVCDV